MNLLIVGGPTAVGKSDVSCLVAQKLDGEIISADSMAVYRFMDIGTAKPLECMKRIKHHLIDVVKPSGYFDAKIFEEEAKRLIKEIQERGKVPMVVGGTYLYIQALLYGIGETPKPDWKLREKLYALAERKGKEFLFKKLQAIDPKYASKIHPNDLRRTVRALEVFLSSGRPFSSYHHWDKPKLKHVGILLIRNRENLFKRIENRLRVRSLRERRETHRGVLARSNKEHKRTGKAPDKVVQKTRLARDKLR